MGSLTVSSVNELLKLLTHPSSQNISMALTTLNTHVLGNCFIDLTLNGLVYITTRLGVLKNLCSDMILGQDFQKKQRSVTIKFDGFKPELIISNLISVCVLSEASLGKPSLLEHLLPGCKPIATVTML